MSLPGDRMIGFAADHMPALRAATERVRTGGRLNGVRVGIALTLEPKTACLVMAAASLGAQVSVLGSSNSTKQAVADSLAARGIEVFAEAGASPTRVLELKNAYIDTYPQLIADDGAGIIRRMHNERTDALEHLRGAAEETTSGVRPLRVMAAEGALRIPCVAVNDARTKLMFDNVYGTGQSVVMAVLDTTGVGLSGRTVVVVGYGKVGRGIASSAAAIGARVVVAEIDPVEALAAHHDGYRVTQLAEALPHADVVITATGIGHSLTAEHMALMRPGAVIAVGGAGPPEFDPSIGPPVTWGDEVRPHLRAAHAAGGPTVFVIADGYCANTSAGEGNPIEIMDLSLALQLRALDYLAGSDLAPGVHLLPRSIDDEVAASQLAAVGILIDTPTTAQTEAAQSW